MTFSLQKERYRIMKICLHLKNSYNALLTPKKSVIGPFIGDKKNAFHIILNS